MYGLATQNRLQAIAGRPGRPFAVFIPPLLVSKDPLTSGIRSRAACAQPRLDFRSTMLLRTLAGQGTAYGLQHLFVDLHQSATTAPIQIADYGQVRRSYG